MSYLLICDEPLSLALDCIDIGTHRAHVGIATRIPRFAFGSRNMEYLIPVGFVFATCIYGLIDSIIQFRRTRN